MYSSVHRLNRQGRTIGTPETNAGNDRRVPRLSRERSHAMVKLRSASETEGAATGTAWRGNENGIAKRFFVLDLQTIRRESILFESSQEFEAETFAQGFGTDRAAICRPACRIDQVERGAGIS